ncbi:hypothetical protein BK140_07290 [Paenibacillus macerans]|uniref:zinc-binding dehydrogenase n=1 Tax=Paenibacillus sp. FSL R5-0527 TaxID=2975321 RepID=UPI00097B8628|nr:hypothetical protein BK140_07290 [Paenibacillus macerans]
MLTKSSIIPGRLSKTSSKKWIWSSIADGTIKAEIDSIFPLNQADKALEKSEARHGRGRILLDINSGLI